MAADDVQNVTRITHPVYVPVTQTVSRVQLKTMFKYKDLRSRILNFVQSGAATDRIRKYILHTEAFYHQVIKNYITFFKLPSQILHSSSALVETVVRDRFYERNESQCTELIHGHGRRDGMGRRGARDDCKNAST